MGRLTEPVFLRLTPELRRRLGVERRNRGGLGVPETVRAVLDEHLPPAPPPIDPNQLTIEEGADQ